MPKNTGTGSGLLERSMFRLLACVNSRLSGLDNDYVCLDFAVYSPASEPLGDRFSSDVGCFAKPRGIPCLDLVPQGCSLAIRDRWNPERFCPTASRQRDDLG